MVYFLLPQKKKIDLYNELSSSVKIIHSVMNIGQNPYLVCTELRYKKMLLQLWAETFLLNIYRVFKFFGPSSSGVVIGLLN